MNTHKKVRPVILLLSILFVAAAVMFATTGGWADPTAARMSKPGMDRYSGSPSARGRTDDSLWFPRIVAEPCDSCDEPARQPVVVYVEDSIMGFSIPVEMPPGVEFCDISFDDCVTENWNMKQVIDSSDGPGWVWVLATNSYGYCIPADTATVFFVEFWMVRDCESSQYIEWDTALYNDTIYNLHYYECVTGNKLYPEFDLTRDETEVVGYKPGDAQGDGSVNIADVTCLLACTTEDDCDCICNWNAADVNGDCVVDTDDLDSLVSYFWHNGKEPQCGCVN